MRILLIVTALGCVAVPCSGASESVMPYVVVGNQATTLIKVQNDTGAEIRGLIEIFSDAGMPIPAFHGSNVAQIEVPASTVPFEINIRMDGPIIMGWGHLIILEYMQKGKWRPLKTSRLIEGTVTIGGVSGGSLKTTTNRFIQVNAAAEFVDLTDEANIFGEHQTVRLINPEREGMSVLMCGCEFAQCNAATAGGCYSKSIPARSAADINALSVRDSHFRSAGKMYSRYTGRFAAIPLLWADSNSTIKFDQ